MFLLPAACLRAWVHVCVPACLGAVLVVCLLVPVVLAVPGGDPAGTWLRGCARLLCLLVPMSAHADPISLFAATLAATGSAAVAGAVATVGSFIAPSALTTCFACKW